MWWPKVLAGGPAEEMVSKSSTKREENVSKTWGKYEQNASKK